MVLKIIKRYFILTIFWTAGLITFGQSVPKGIFYQAVARDNYGKELVNKDIDVKFSIISGTPLGTIVYQELHSHVITSKFGVFTRVIGTGTHVGGIYEDLSQIQWSQADHFLKVEVKFDNDFLDMGTMQFLTVPYALYAQKSLEPGPAGPPGPKGETGDPGSQTLSFNGSNLAISGGNTVNLSSLNTPNQLSLLGDTLSILGGNKVGLTNQIQDLALDINNKLKITKNSAATEIDLSPFKQNLSYNAATGILSISNGTAADISSLKTIGIQDIHLTGNLLTIDKNLTSTGVDLSKYLDNTDNQNLSFDQSTNTLSIERGSSVVLGSTVAFRAKKTSSDTGLSLSTDYDFITPVVEYNDGSGFNGGTGIFTAPVAGIYTFIVGYNASGTGGSRELKLSLNGTDYEILNNEISSGSIFTRSITIKLNAIDKVKVLYNRGMASESGTGSFSGYKVY
jgi:hypothetical protein